MKLIGGGRAAHRTRDEMRQSLHRPPMNIWWIDLGAEIRVEGKTY